MSRADFAEAVAREGCIGETLAALDAAARLSVATDPEVRTTLEVIAEDESCHGALAWRTFHWLLRDDGDGAVRRRLAVVFGTARLPDFERAHVSTAVSVMRKYLNVSSTKRT